MEIISTSLFHVENVEKLNKNLVSPQDINMKYCWFYPFSTEFSTVSTLVENLVLWIVEKIGFNPQWLKFEKINVDNALKFVNNSGWRMSFDGDKKTN